MALNILVVDDSALMRSIVVRAIKAGRSAAEIFEAANGAEALEIMGRSRVDMAFVDLNMPVMRGEELIERMRSNAKLQNVPVVVISAEGESLAAQMVVKKNFTNFVRKPFSPATLKIIIADALALADLPAAGAKEAANDGGTGIA